MEREYILKLPEETVKLAKEKGVELCLSTDNIAKNDLPDNAVPDVTGVCIGYVDKDTDKLVSYIKNDTDGSVLREHINAGLTVTKVFSQMTSDNKKRKDVPYYFIVYDVMASSKQRPTYTEMTSGYGVPTNGGYECEYEILLGMEEYTRRMVFKYRSVNSMYNWLLCLLAMIEDEDDSVSDNFYRNAEGELCFTMFDNVGITTEVAFDMFEFESMIVGIRQLSCRFVNDIR